MTFKPFLEVYDNLFSMTSRVIKNDGFFEWNIVDIQPEESGTFRGSIGVLYKSIVLLGNWAKNDVN